MEPHVDGVNALLIAADGGYEDIVRLLLGRAGAAKVPSQLSLHHNAAQFSVIKCEEATMM